MPLFVPARIETDRLLLRPWRAEDAPALKAVIDVNLQHLQAWLPWAMDEPSRLPTLAARIRHFAAAFASGSEWVYGIFSRAEHEILGGCGLHPRIGPAGLEIGYWIRSEETRRGYATEAAGVLTHVALGLPGIDRVEIHCDPRNVASAGVPRRLGYRHVTTLRQNARTPRGESRDTMVWRFTGAEFAARKT